MCAHGLWDILVAAVTTSEFKEFAVIEGFEKRRRGILVGGDASIWLNECQHALNSSGYPKGNGAILRALFYRPRPCRLLETSCRCLCLKATGTFSQEV